jgi:hypothetical protein
MGFARQESQRTHVFLRGRQRQICTNRKLVAEPTYDTSPKRPSAKSPRKKLRFLRENGAFAASEIGENREHPRNTPRYPLEKVADFEETPRKRSFLTALLFKICEFEEN